MHELSADIVKLHPSRTLYCGLFKRCSDWYIVIDMVGRS